MSTLSRRDLVATVAAISAGVALRPTGAQATEATRLVRAAQANGGFAPKVYTAHEWATVRMLVDYIIPKDDRSGSATDALVPEFMDTILDLEPGMRTAHRGGLAWLDHEMRERTGADFVSATDAERRELLDLIAFPRTAPAELTHGVQWFNSFRDLTATGFYTSEIGVNDLGYTGNTHVGEWTGCTDEAYRHLGVERGET
ncbi:MAG: gluconate 2-dehydrogenase subunit 3 family protein [Gemmatimonadales bacterium]|nr:gluconate 2-dehydrogenase subunit 3 family protein [Gemmatimonadales bacterium]